MRRLLPLALLLAGCSTPPAAPQASPPAAPTPKVVPTDLTPESLAKAADVPLYPGAEAPDGMSSVPDKRSDGSTHYSLVLATKDPVAKAAAWYAAKLGVTAMPDKGGRSLFGTSKAGNDLMIVVAPEAGRTLIRIKSIAYAR